MKKLRIEKLWRDYKNLNVLKPKSSIVEWHGLKISGWRLSQMIQTFKSTGVEEIIVVPTEATTVFRAESKKKDAKEVDIPVSTLAINWKSPTGNMAGHYTIYGEHPDYRAEYNLI